MQAYYNCLPAFGHENETNSKTYLSGEIICNAADYGVFVLALSDILWTPYDEST